jgi:hypothetical protein
VREKKGQNLMFLVSLLHISFAGAAVTILAADAKTCVIVSGSTACWGRGTRGATGRGDQSSVGANPGDMTSIAAIPFISSTLVVASISSSIGSSKTDFIDHTCVLFTNKQVF